MAQHAGNCATEVFSRGLQEYDPCKGYLVNGEWVDDEPECDCGQDDEEA